MIDYKNCPMAGLPCASSKFGGTESSLSVRPAAKALPTWCNLGHAHWSRVFVNTA